LSGLPGCDVRIGTSGWQYRHWRGPFYERSLPTTRWLPFYAEHFDTVEINTSFYGLPSEKTVGGWREATAPDFRFAAKGSRYLTHLKRLKDPVDSLERLYSRLDHLGDKLAVILFQLPPRWPCDLDRLREFLAALRPERRYALEFRDQSWHNEGVFDLLRQHNIAWCAYELAGFRSAMEITADFVYVRLHGPQTEAYRGSYSDTELQGWAKRIRGWQRSLKAVYIYFDNDEAGFAVRNASRLRNLVGDARESVLRRQT
jgi:uncharacterized protein YecE (DUF72 family)